MKFDTIIVGAGHAGAQTAASLRQQKYEGSIALIGDEPSLPYERPPLSKEYLAGEKEFGRILIKPEAFWQSRNIELFPGTSVVKVDSAEKKIETSIGQVFSYKNLVWATGGRARMLSCPGSDLKGVHVVRAKEHVDAIKGALPHVNDVVIIGGGYIGLEAAAVFRKLGKNVVLLEAADRVLARVAGEEISNFYEQEHRSQGVDIRTNQKLDGFAGKSGRIEGVILEDGGTVRTDMAIVGIGLETSTAPLEAAGANCQNGVIVDEFCRSSLKHVFAVGDCTVFESKYTGGVAMRVESVQNANDQAATVASVIAGNPKPYDALPWFWSNQYDLKLQTAGLNVGFDQTLVRGDMQARSFSVLYLKSGRLIAIDCVNAGRDWIQGKKLIEAGCHPDLSLAADPDIPLKDLLPC